MCVALGVAGLAPCRHGGGHDLGKVAGVGQRAGGDDRSGDPRGMRLLAVTADSPCKALWHPSR